MFKCVVFPISLPERAPHVNRHHCRPQTLRFIGYWLNSIAYRGPDAPVLLVGTHKDQLAWVRLSEAQELVASHIYGMHIAAEIVQHISKPSERELFFAVDSRSRKPSDPTLADVRKELSQVIKKDQRKVTGLRVGRI